MSTDGLLRLLRARDPDLVDQGVALAVALGDPQLFDSLLEGVEFGEYSNRGALPRRGPPLDLRPQCSLFREPQYSAAAGPGHVGPDRAGARGEC
ncbi:MAG TPA: hypothetical protein PKY30_19410, partial [Myxococcota bacterium]|nr:hypothetical protein [Myxococcota bacterium]